MKEMKRNYEDNFINEENHFIKCLIKIFFILFKLDEDLQYMGRKFVNKTICSEEFQN